MTAKTYFKAPDTSDKRDDECWVEYWDRKRHERHGLNCNCVLCTNEELFKADHGWCPHTYASAESNSGSPKVPYINDPEVIDNEISNG